MNTLLNHENKEDKVDYPYDQIHKHIRSLDRRTNYNSLYLPIMGIGFFIVLMRQDMSSISTLIIFIIFCFVIETASLLWHALGYGNFSQIKTIETISEGVGFLRKANYDNETISVIDKRAEVEITSGQMLTLLPILLISIATTLVLSITNNVIVFLVITGVLFVVFGRPLVKEVKNTNTNKFIRHSIAEYLHEKNLQSNAVVLQQISLVQSLPETNLCGTGQEYEI